MRKHRRRYKQIAELPGSSAETICRGLQRDTGKKGRRPKQAQAKTGTRREQAAKAVEMIAAVIVLGEEKIGLDWGLGKSPGGWQPNKDSRSATSGPISTFRQTSGMAVG